MIPHVFHHVWLGSDLPDEAERLRGTWRDQHPTWEFRLWTMDELDWLENQALFDRAPSYPQKADIARYEIIRRFGGIYLDTDLECLRPIDDLLTDDLTFFAGREADSSVNIAILGATPGHPLLDQVIATLPISCLLNRRRGVNMQTGPRLMTEVIDRLGWASQPGVRIFPPAFFYPYDWSEPWRNSERFRTAFAAHHWGHSWSGVHGVQADIGDLIPHDWSDLMVKTTSLGYAAIRRSSQTVRNRVAEPSQRAVKRVVRRFLRQLQPAVHAIPWGRDHVLVATPLGTRLLVPVQDISLAPELALTGVYDEPFIDFLARSLRPGMTFVDVGANVGLFTIVGAALVGAGGRVFAYECNPGLVDSLRKNVQMNWFNDRVELVPKAAGRDDSSTTFWMSDRLAGLGSTVPGNALDSNNDDVGETVVITESLDERLSDVPFVDLLKIDVEGGEPAVLDGARGLLTGGKIGIISLEFKSESLTDDAYTEMADHLAELEGWGATFHVPGDRRTIPLDEVLVACHYPQLICRFPNATIPSP